MYENCSGYLSEEMAILDPDVIITQSKHGNPPRSKARVERYVFQNYQKVKNIQGINPVHNVANVATLSVIADQSFGYSCTIPVMRVVTVLRLVIKLL